MNTVALWEKLVAALPPEGFASFESVKDRRYSAAILENPLHKRRLETLNFRLDLYRKQPLETLPFSLFTQFEQTGDRSRYEKKYFDRRMRLQTLALSCWLDKKKPDFTLLTDVIWAVCEETTWCLPAHFVPESFFDSLQNGGLQEKNGITTGAFPEPERKIDLFAAETAFALAEVLWLLEEDLPPAVAIRARREIVRRVLSPFLSFEPLSRWELMGNNWNAVCAGAIGGTALYVIEDEKLLTPLLQKVFNTLEGYVAGFGDDGVCTEGLAYWTYGFGFYVCFADLLFKRTGGAVDLLSQPKIARIAQFQQNAYFDRDAAVSFSDALPKEPFRIGLASYLAARYEGVRIPDENFQLDFDGDPCARFCLCLRDFLWTQEYYQKGREKEQKTACLNKKNAPDEPLRSVWYPDAQWLIARAKPAVDDSSAEPRAFFAAKGGHNGESHNHNDIGSFIYRARGTTFLSDFGSGEYTKEYFSSRRYESFSPCSRSHSVPIVNGCYQREGRSFCANSVLCKISAERDELGLDLSAAYGQEDLRVLRRDFIFNKEKGELTLFDTFIFSQAAKEVRERFVSEQVMSLEDGFLVIRDGEKSCLLGYDKDPFAVKISCEDFLNHQGIRKKAWIADFIVKAPLLERMREFRFEFTLIPPGKTQKTQ